MSNETPGVSPAGWFPDQVHAGMERYFDGAAWTSHVRPVPPSPQRRASEQPQFNAPTQQLPVAVPIPPGGGARVSATAPITPALGNPLLDAPDNASPRSFFTTWLLSLLLGVLGADRFYLGKTGTGVLKLVTVGGVGIWWLVDLVTVLSGNATDSHGTKVRGTEKQPTIAWAVTGAFIMLGLVAGATSLDREPERDVLVIETPRNSSTAPSSSESAPSGPTASTSTSSPAASTSTTSPSQTTTSQQPPASGGAGNSGATVSQQQAVAKARSYLNIMAFSRSGLIDQLEFEGFSTADATYGVDQLGANWNEQAARMARTYLDIQAFSRMGLIDQLEFEGFSTAEATYGVDQLGANWNEQAARMAQAYLDIHPFSHAELVNQLEFEGFTHAEAEYGVSSTGL